MMETYFYLRSLTKVCKTCKEPATQQVVRRGSHEVLGEYCYDHAQLAIMQMERAEQSYREVMDKILSPS